MTSIQREPASRRRFYRLTVPITVDIGGGTYTAEDWSIGGFRVVGLREPVAEGEVVECTVHMPFQGFNVSFEQRAKVVRSGGGEAAFEFVELNERSREVLEFFSRGLVSGELANVDDVIQRIDIPVTPIPAEPNKGWPDQTWDRRIKRVLMGTFFAALALGIIAYFAVTIYSRLFRLEVETAVVAAAREEVSAPLGGQLQEAPVTAGMTVDRNDILCVLENPALARELEEARLGLEEARLGLKEAEAKVAIQREKVDIYGHIAELRAKAASDRVRALEKETALVAGEFGRKKGLLAEGALAQTELDLEEARLTRIRERLDTARAELLIAQEALAAVKKGMYFSGTRLEGGIAELEAEVATAREHVKLEEEQLVAVKKEYGVRVVRAPFAGKVVEVFRSVGNHVERGRALVLMERSNERYIEAFVTQSQATQIRVGSTARVYVPASDRRMQAEVISVDRTAGHTEAEGRRFLGQTTETRSACVRLVFREADLDELRRISTGWPVIVNFERARARG